MGNKTIPELQPITSPDVNQTFLAVDDGTQTFKMSLNQILKHPRAYQPAMTYIPNSASTLSTSSHCVEIYLLKTEGGDEFWIAEINAMLEISFTTQTGFQLAFAGLEFADLCSQPAGVFGSVVGGGTPLTEVFKAFTEAGMNRITCVHTNLNIARYAVTGRFLLTGKPDFVEESMLVVETGQGSFSGTVPRDLIDPGTADFVLINGPDGKMSEEQFLARARGGFGVDTTGATGFLRFNGASPPTYLSTIPETALPTGINAEKIGNGSVNNTEWSYISTLTSNAQTQLNNLSFQIAAKANSADVSDALALKADINFSLLVGPRIEQYAQIKIESEPGSPPAGQVRIFAVTGGKLKKKTESGVVSDLGGGGTTPTARSGAFTAEPNECAQIDVTSGPSVMTLPDTAEAVTVEFVDAQENCNETNYIRVAAAGPSTTIDGYPVGDTVSYTWPRARAKFTKAAGETNWKIHDQMVTSVTPGQIPGTTTNDGAAPGNVGEFIAPRNESVAAGSNGAWKTLNTITLQPGDWDVSAVGVHQGNSGVTWSYAAGQSPGLCLVPTADSGAGVFFPYNYVEGTPPSSGGFWGQLVIPCVRLSLAVPTTYYLNGRLRYTAGTPTWSTVITARRVR